MKPARKFPSSVTMKRIEPIKKPLHGVIAVPGDKSIAHRAVIFGSIARGRTRIFNLSGGEDNSRTVRAFRQLGVEIAGAMAQIDFSFIDQSIKACIIGQVYRLTQDLQGQRPVHCTGIEVNEAEILGQAFG